MPTSAAFSVSGIITDGDGRPVRDAEVTAIASRARRRQRRVGVATTGDDGRYRIDVPAVEEDEWLEVWIEVSLAERSFGRSDSFDPQPELTEIDLQVHLDGEQHEETDEEHAAREKREQEEREHNAEKNFRVAGKRDQYGDLLPSVTIEVYDCDLRNKELLGQTTTSQDAAHYEVSYGQFQFARAEKASADLIIRVLGPTAKLLASHPWFRMRHPQRRSMSI